MKIIKRKQFGKALLTASIGLGVSVVGCIDNKDDDTLNGSEVVNDDTSYSGNLMPPPMVELCIDVTPDEANVTVNETTVSDGECTDIYEGNPADIEASAEGYENFSETITVTEDMTYAIEMTPLGTK